MMVHPENKMHDSHLLQTAQYMSIFSFLKKRGKVLIDWQARPLRLILLVSDNFLLMHDSRCLRLSGEIADGFLLIGYYIISFSHLLRCVTLYYLHYALHHTDPHCGIYLIGTQHVEFHWRNTSLTLSPLAGS